jgi:hypothetical protein
MSLAEIRLRIQVIDINPRQIDITVPRYLAADNLSQRIIRDAGLQSHWRSGYRRNYTLRARGRVLHPKETLEQLGVVDGELIYLLPEPDEREGVLEQNPEYPEVKSYLGQGSLRLVLMIVLVLSFSFLWGMALTTSKHWVVTILPSLGLATLCVSFARHAWGGRAFQMKIGITALVLYLIALVPPFLAPVVQSGMEVLDFLKILVPGIVMGFASLIISWLAWWGAVEPLNRQVVREQRALEQDTTLPKCGICVRDVEIEFDTVCQYQCGRHFHSGCISAKQASFQGDARLCAVCNVRVG